MLRAVDEQSLKVVQCSYNQARCRISRESYISKTTEPVYIQGPNPTEPVTISLFLVGHENKR